MIRPAVPGDREALGAMLDRAFAKSRPGWFLDRLPHLFADGAIGQNLLAVEGAAILGCVGCYRFEATLWGAPVVVGGIGQVGTVPEARGRGLMTELLGRSLARDPSIDLYYLYGDRARYGRVGFAPGGLQVEAPTWGRYVLGLGGDRTIRALDLDADATHVGRAMEEQGFVVRLGADERSVMLRGKGVKGWTDGEACLLLDGEGTKAWAASGEPRAVARLVAHQVASREAAVPRNSGLTLVADPSDRRMLDLMRQVGATFGTRPTAMLRVGNLPRLLAAWGASRVPPAIAGLKPCVLDGGEAGRVRVAVEDGRWRIAETDEAADLRLEGAALAELVFGTLPAAAWDWPGDGVLRHLLPLHFAIPYGYEL